MSKREIIWFCSGLAMGGLVCAAIFRAQHNEMVDHGNVSVSSHKSDQSGATSSAINAAETSRYFKNGPLGDESFWKAMNGSPSERRAALNQKTTEILHSSAVQARRRWFAILLENYQAGDLDSIHQGMMAQEKLGGRFNKEFEMMMNRVAEVEGKLMMDKINDANGPPGTGAHAWEADCMATWSGVEPDEAVTWWNALPDGHLRDFLAPALLDGLARENPEKAWAAAQHFDAPQRADFAAQLAKGFAQNRGAESAIDWVASLGPEEGTAKARALNELADYMHGLDGARESKLLEKFADAPWLNQTNAFETFARYWAMREGVKAIDWADGLPPSAKQQALPAAIKRWAEADSEQAGKWVQTQQSAPDFAQKSQWFLEQLQQQQSPKLADWRNTLTGQ